MGSESQCTYLHDLVYVFPVLVERVGHVLRVSMEGFEHANKVTKTIFRYECSKGGKKGADGTRRDEWIQGIQHRRAGTAAAHSMNRINATA
eukprot:4222275-Pleurochrysis_carterae.AAC.1